MIGPEQEALIGRVFETYLAEHHRGDLLHLTTDTNREIHHPVVVNAMTLFEANMELGDYFNAYPDDVLAVFDKVLQRTAMELSEKVYPRKRIRHIPHARVTGLPVCPELTRDTIPRSRDVGHFLSVTGTVIRTSVTKVLEYERDYMCTKCHHVFTMQADFEQYYTFVQLVACPNPDGCYSNKFSCLSGGSEPASCRDYQEIKIQEQVQKLSVGSIPRSMVVILQDDLVDSCKSGDDVTVYGVMCQRWKPLYDGTRCDVELVLKANNIEVNNQQAAAGLVIKDVHKEFDDFWNSYKDDPIAGRNQILLSLCPQIFGMYLIKLAVAMVLAGGVQRIDSSGTKIRGECHMLLVGDPGTGKSQFLKYAAKIMPRSVLTAGIGSTSAGLTVAAVKDGGDWHLEAGALVLSDGGLCCIDEFNSIKEHDRISIHEAMEQQSISVAKAGMVCKLNTRTTILASTNPKGQYNPSEPLSVNVALASPLLSRFDLVLVLMDTRNAEWDRIISSFILEERGLLTESSCLWTMEKMKAYFSVIKSFQPQVSQEANSILTRYYQLQRQSDSRNTARTTIRMLESLSRLAEAHARLMYRKTVTIEDAVMAVSVMECSMQGGALLGSVNALLTSFPADPGQQYRIHCQMLLEGLNLPLLLQKEMVRLAELKSNAPEAFPPTDNYPYQLRKTTPINRTHCYDCTSDCEDDGLDWFHSITPSELPDDVAFPIITLTQQPPNSKPDFTDILSCPFGTISSASEEKKMIIIEKNENIDEKSSSTQDKMKDGKHPESLGCVFQKVSRNLRDRNHREQGLKQQCTEETEGRHRERVASTESPSINVIDVLTSEFHTSSRLSSGKNCPSNSLAQDKLSSGKGSRSAKTGTSISAVLWEKMAAEAGMGKEFHAELSGFVFKPRQMRSSVYNHDLNVSTEFQSQCSQDNRDFHTDINGTSQQKSISHDELATPQADTEKNKRRNQDQHLCEDGSCRKQACCVSDMRDRNSETSVCFTSKELDNDFSFEKDEASHALLKPSTYISDPEPSKSSPTKCTVVSSTQAKLSRFSFTGTAKLMTKAQIQGDKHSPIAVEKQPLKRDSAELTRGNCKDEITLNPSEHSPSGQKIFHDVLKDILPAPGTRLKAGQKHELVTHSPTQTMSKCTEKQIQPLSVKRRNDVETVNDCPVSLKKRMPFELVSPPRNVGATWAPFSEQLQFDSADLANDVLDTDWDREGSKKNKG